MLLQEPLSIFSVHTNTHVVSVTHTQTRTHKPISLSLPRVLFQTQVVYALNTLQQSSTCHSGEMSYPNFRNFPSTYPDVALLARLAEVRLYHAHQCIRTRTHTTAHAHMYDPYVLKCQLILFAPPTHSGKWCRFQSDSPGARSWGNAQ